VTVLVHTGGRISQENPVEAFEPFVTTHEGEWVCPFAARSSKSMGVLSRLAISQMAEPW